MIQSEAVARARAFVLTKTGVDADPDAVHLGKTRTAAPTWYVLYYAAHFFPEVAAGRATVDGGEYCVLVDDKTGQVSESI